MNKFALIALSLLAASAAGATTYTVPGDYGTIQAAIDACVPGDIVEIACGTYVEALEVAISGITLRGASLSPSCVTVDANGGIRALYLNGNSTPLTGLTVEGIEFTGATRNGVSAYVADVEFNYCSFRDNVSTGWSGAGAYLYTGSAVTFNNCFFLNNSTPDDGAGVFVFYTDVISFTNCTFFGNVADDIGGGASINGSDATFTSCSFSENSGGSIPYPAGGISHQYGGALTLDRTIIAFSGDGHAVDITNSPTITVSCCNIYGNDNNNGGEEGDWVENLFGLDGANGNFSLDPQFCGEAGVYNLELQSDSPCAQANLPGDAAACGDIGALAVGCLETAVEATTWSAVKGLY